MFFILFLMYQVTHRLPWSALVMVWTHLASCRQWKNNCKCTNVCCIFIRWKWKNVFVFLVIIFVSFSEISLQVLIAIMNFIHLYQLLLRAPHTYTHTHTYTHIHTQYTHIFIYVCVYIHIYIYIYIFIYLFIYIHTVMNTGVTLSWCVLVWCESWVCCRQTVVESPECRCAALGGQ